MYLSQIKAIVACLKSTDFDKLNLYWRI